MTLFTDLPPAPADPILGVTEQFNADPNPAKVNLGVGIYLDEQGRLPLMKCVDLAEERLAAAHQPRNYLPIDGMAAYNQAVRALVFGADREQVRSGRIITIESLAGTGALKVGADFLHQLSPEAKVLVSSPSWANHRALFTRAGFQVAEYHYYDAERHGIAFEQMLADLRAAAPGTIVVLHACCHNPTGYDLNPAQWDEVITACDQGRLIPFLDMAYQGFATTPEKDSAAVRTCVERLPMVFCATSFSKTLGLYGERIGSLSVLCASAEEAERVRSQLKIVVRTNYSNPPTHGAAIVTTVLNDPELLAMWHVELAQMRDRIKQMRLALVAALEARGITDMGFITQQMGMFSYCGLSAEQMRRLRDEFSVYGLDSGRICLAGFTPSNIDYVADAIVAVR